MATIKFYLQSKNKPAGIYVRLRDGVNTDAKAKTKFAINPGDWSTAKGKPKDKDESFKELDTELIKFKNDLLNHYNKSVGKMEINSQWLKDFIYPPPSDNIIPLGLVPYIDYYIQNKSTAKGSSAYKRNNVYKALIKRFVSASKKEYLIKEVDANFKLKFETYCLRENYAPNTISRAVKFIKTICYDARYNGLEIHYQLEDIKVTFEKSEKIYLTTNELNLIENSKKIEAEHLVNARDWLLISCETGQRVSDFLRFTKEMIRYVKDKKGITKPLIEFTQIKTNKKMAVPLNSKIIAILKKRNGEFPRQISDQKYNDYVKDVCKLAGLTEKVKGSLKDPKTNRKKSGTFEKWELVSSHIGRRSFATNNYGRIPTALLIGATGHSTEKMFLEYIGKSDSDKALQLAEYF